jgi:uncharacterized protein
MDAQWRQRRRRIRSWLKPLPRRASIHRYPFLKRFAAITRGRGYLWSFQNAAVTRAIYCGSLLAFLPSYGLQIAIALLVAWFARANLTVMVALQLIINPLTAAPIYWLTYTLGMRLMEPARLLTGQPVFDGGMALMLGGLMLGALVGVLLHGLWLFGRFEARNFRARRKAYSGD